MILVFLLEVAETADFVDFSAESSTSRQELKGRITNGILEGTEIDNSTWYPWMVSIHKFGKSK